MSSGNFAIGKDLSLEGFNHYIKPILEKYKSEVTDVFSYVEEYSERVLVSLIGDAKPEALERILRISIEEVLPKVKEDLNKYSSRNDFPKSAVWEHHINNTDGAIFNTIGLYSDNKTASRIFQNLAVKYSLIDLESQLEKTEDNLRIFSEKFKNF
jgi:hypothetical protein